MKETDKIIDFIADYISAYENKIKLKNKLGLYDCAKLFESFAIEISKLYFNQTFHNCNDENAQFPYIDLLSEDGKTFVQVTTEKDLPNKISKTLNKISKSEKDFYKRIGELYFIALHNDSVDKVQDYIGNNKIGNIDFEKDKNLITTQNILSKAISDSYFRGELYKLLKKEELFLNDTSKIEHALNTSKNKGLAKITDTIGGKYRLDISNYLQEIEKENAKNLLIEGKAGSGKSVLCKKLCENKSSVLYARAERFSKETSLDEIWHFDIIRALEFLESEEIIIFIDALEYVADSRAKIELLEELYECCSKYNNVRIITSCRSSDKTAFLGLIASYQISCYLIKDIDKKELLKIAKVFPVIKSALKIDRYEKILLVPFYLDLLTRFKSLSDINDENEFRELIWRECICLNDPSLENVITSIVLDRAKYFLIGVDACNYDYKVVERLLSNGVIIKIGDAIRLSYDIFEDICFERYIDKCFVACRCNYNIFFSRLNQLGECLYRRYQIWIDDKLLSKVNREKFIYHLLFSKKLPKKWRDQTIIGLIKSKHGDLFFLDYGQSIVDNGLLNDFIDKTNLYGFEVNLYIKKENYTLLKPVGSGREFLIELLCESNLYKSINAHTNSYLKLCTDYSLCRDRKTDITKKASDVLCFYVDFYINNYLSDKSLHDDVYKHIKNVLTSIYVFCPTTSDWLKVFFERMKTMYLSKSRREQMVAEDVFENLFNLSSASFALQNPSYYLSLFEFYFGVEKPKNDSFPYYHLEREDRISLWGFNENAESYEHETVNKEVIRSLPFFLLFTTNLFDGLKWLIGFCNRTVEDLVKNVTLEKYKVVFHDTGIVKEYYGYGAMWLASSVDYQVPLIISDLLYSFKLALKQRLEETKDVFEKTSIADKVRDYIYEHSNNLMLLCIISEIGQYFFADLHGYAIDLASNIDFVMADYSRQVFEMADPARNKLTSNIESVMGMPGLWKKRYKPMNSESSLCDYFVKCWVYYRDELSEKCRKIIKQLYLEVPNNKENAQKYLQIQKMDLDSSKKYLLDNKNIVVSPVVTGEAQKVVDAQSKIDKGIVEIGQKVEQYSKMLESGTCSIDELKEFLAFLLSIKDKSISAFMIENIIGVISLLLERKGLDDVSRKNYIDLFVGYGYEMMKDIVVFDKTEIFAVLFNQLNQDINDSSARIIKKLMLDLIFYRGQNNIIYSLVMQVSLFLKTNSQIDELFFNTIIELAKDEMEHQIHNADIVIKSGKEKGFVFKPNLQPHLRGVDREINRYGGQPYQSKEKEIIVEYLLKGKERNNKSDFNLDNYDVSVLSRIFLCHISLQHEYHFNIAKDFLLFLIKMWHLRDYSPSNIIDYVDIDIFKRFLASTLTSNYENAQKVIDLLFNDIDFSLFKIETIEFYCEVFNFLGAHYFDAYKNYDKRSFIENVFKLLEDKICSIGEEGIREELLYIMIFGNPRGSRFGDNWIKLSTAYSYKDKMFLNTYFSKYGYLHLESYFETLHRFHLNELLPEILISLNISFKNALKRGKKYRDRYGKSFEDIILEYSDFINTIISISFFDYRKKIKEDEELTNAFVGILKVLIDLKYEQAAVFLDEFLVH